MIKTLYDGSGNEAFLLDSASAKILQSKDGSFNHFFNKQNGYSEVYGRTREDDPDYSPFGPLIADIEITTICAGPRNEKGIHVPCNFCYKSNSPDGTYMSLDTFKEVFIRLPKTIGQIAFGVDATGTSNPDMFEIFEFTRENGVVPNLTIADVSDEVADKIAALAGACAVSLYDNKDVCYDSVKKLTDRGMTQCNIHFCYNSANYHKIHDIISDIKTDPRLSKLNAIVFLALKQKGRGIGFKPLEFDKFKVIVEKLLDNEIRFGFDSCSANPFLKAVKDHPLYENFLQMSEPCESTLFSSYIDVHGDFYPCSFCEKIEGWENGISVKDCINFIDDVWFNEMTIKFRHNLIDKKRSCPVYDI